MQEKADVELEAYNTNLVEGILWSAREVKAGGPNCWVWYCAIKNIVIDADLSPNSNHALVAHVLRGLDLSKFKTTEQFVCLFLYQKNDRTHLSFCKQPQPDPVMFSKPASSHALAATAVPSVGADLNTEDPEPKLSTPKLV